MKTKSIIFSLVMLFFVLPSNEGTAATQDTTPPKIEVLEVLTKEASVGDKIQVKVKATDDISGMTSLSVTFKSPNGRHSTTGSIYIANETEDDTYIITLEPINAYAEQGTWYISRFYGYDKAGNYQDYSYGNEYYDKLKPVVTVDVKNNQVDITPPTIEVLEVLNKEANVGDKIQVKVKATDDISGMTSLSVTFKSPNGRHSTTGSIYIANETEDDTYIITLEPINAYAEQGTWYISRFYGYDKAGNYQDYSYGNEYYDKLKPVVTVDVKNNQVDITPPTIEVLEVLNKEVNVGDKIQVKVKATDDISGMTSLSVTFKSPNGRHSTTGSIYIANETEDDTYIITLEPINAYAEQGTWYISRFYGYDKAGNYQDYSYGNEYYDKLKPVATFTVGKATEKPVTPTPDKETPTTPTPTNPTPTDEKFKVWEAKDNVDKSKKWTVKFALPFDPLTIYEENNIYVTDSKGNRVSTSFIIDNTSETGATINASLVTILAPYGGYAAGETYTLYIKNVKGKNGEILKQFVKMDFTIKAKHNDVIGIS